MSLYQFIAAGIVWAGILGVLEGLKDYVWDDAPLRTCAAANSAPCEWQALPQAAD